MQENSAVIVVGAGVVGTTTAYELARRGASVTLLDRAPDIGGGCSYANAGVLAPDHVGPLATRLLLVEGARQMFMSPPAVRVNPSAALMPWLTRLVGSTGGRRVALSTARLQELAHRSAELHRRFAAAGHSPTYRHTGALEVHMEHGTGGAGLSRAQAHALVPALGDVAEAHLSPNEAVVDSRSYARSMVGLARDHGADVRFGVEVQGLVTEGARVVGVRADGMTLHADRVVLATGLATTSLAASAGVRVPLRGGRGYVVDLDVDEAPSLPVRLKERRMVITPFADRMRVCGLMELGAEGRPIDPRRPEEMLEVVSAALPGTRIHGVIETWVGERPCAADGVPVIGSSGRADGLTIAAGHGMWGLILAPVTAEMVATGLLEGAPTLHEPLLTPDRFGGPRHTAALAA